MEIIGSNEVGKIVDAMAKVIVMPASIAVACSLIILCAFFIYYFGFKGRIHPLVKQMKEALSRIRTLPELPDFFASFREFDQWAGEHLLLGHLWRQFRETLIMPSATTEKPIIRNTAEASCCFNENTIISSRINLRFYNAFPNYLTGAGILGTFIGLVAGIYLASKGLSSNEGEALKTGLQNLLSGASLAFLTSIAGLLTSIIFSWREKAITHKLSKLVGDWGDELDRRIMRVTPEYIAGKQLEELKQQTVYQEEFVTRVAFNISEALGKLMEQHLVPGIADALDQRMNERLVPALEKLVVAVDKMREERGHTNDQLLQKIVEQFTQTITGAAGKEVTALAGTLKGLRDDLAPILTSMKDAGKDMKINADLIAKGIKNSYSESNKAFSEGIDKAINNLQGAIDRAGTTFGDSLNKELIPLIADLKKSQTDMQELANRLPARFEDAAKQSSQSFAEGTGKAIEQLEKGIAKAGAVLHGELKVAFDHAVSELKRTTQDLNGVLSGIQRTGGDVKGIIANAGDLLNRFGVAAQHFVALEGKLAGLVQSLELSAQSIRDGGEAAKEAMAHVRVSSEALKEASGKFRETFEAVRKNLENYSTHLASLDTDLEKVFSKMHGGLATYAEATKKYMAEMDKHAAEVTRGFGGAVNELNETLEGLSESLQKLVEIMTRFRQSR